MEKIPATLLFFLFILLLRNCNSHHGDIHSAASFLKIKSPNKNSDSESTEKLHHPIPDDIIHLIQSVSYDGGCTDTVQYGKYDSTDTRYYDLTVCGEGKYYLIEDDHYCGEANGSCGDQIWVVKKDKNGNGKILFEDCGWIDTVLSTSHNGMFDFRIQYRTFYRELPVFFRWTGNEIVEYDDPKPKSDTDAIAETLLRYYPKRWFDENGIKSSVGIQFEKFGKTSDRFAIVNDGVFEKYLLRARTPGNYEVVNYFPETVLLDILESSSNSMNDIATYTFDMRKTIWKWNGNEYAKEK